MNQIVQFASGFLRSPKSDNIDHKYFWGTILGDQTSMFRTSMALAFAAFLLSATISNFRERSFIISFVTSAAAQDRLPSVNPVDRLRVGRPRWRRRGDLIYGDMTIRNANRYSVHNVTIACDFFGKWGNQVGTKTAEVPLVLDRGRTRVRGIHFNVSVPNMLGGACRVVSATRVS